MFTSQRNHDHYHSVDMNGVIPLVNSFKGYFVLCRPFESTVWYELPCMIYEKSFDMQFLHSMPFFDAS